MNFAQTMRIIWIDVHLADWGQVRRYDICVAFGLSMPKASDDIYQFAQRFPDRLRYDGSTKAYVAAGEPVFGDYARSVVMDAQDAVRHVVVAS